jgi:hypothetical protein
VLRAVGLPRARIIVAFILESFVLVFSASSERLFALSFCLFICQSSYRIHHRIRINRSIRFLFCSFFYFLFLIFDLFIYLFFSIILFYFSLFIHLSIFYFPLSIYPCFYLFIPHERRTDGPSHGRPHRHHRGVHNHHAARLVHSAPNPLHIPNQSQPTAASALTRQTTLLIFVLAILSSFFSTFFPARRLIKVMPLPNPLTRRTPSSQTCARERCHDA